MNKQEFGRIGSALSGITSGGGGGGSSFAYTPDQMRDIINDWLDLADDFLLSLGTTEPMVTVEGPGTEFASQSHAGVANTSGQAYRDSLQSDWDYCISQAQKFQDTLHDYIGLEHRSVTEINRSAPRDGF